MCYLKMFSANVGIWTLAAVNWVASVPDSYGPLHWVGVVGACLVSLATAFKLITEGLLKMEEIKEKRKAGR